MKQLHLFILSLTGLLLLAACEDQTPSTGPVAPRDTVSIQTPYSGTLPVLHINTEQGRAINSKEEYQQAEWWLDDLGLECYESIGSQDEPLTMLIKGQGNYTWVQYPKKSYRLKLETKQPLMGMKKSRHWVLLAHYDDYLARLKNTMGFELSRRIGLTYTPDQRPVEVIVNNKYMGLYFLTEKIRVDKNRVNIEKQDEFETSPTAIAAGAWLLEVDNHPGDNCISINERDNATLAITYHSPENLSSQQEQYLNEWMARVNTAIYSTDKSSDEWEQYIDIDTLAMYYIIGEIMDDMEYFSGSCYMYKRQGVDAKLIFGPVWDFGNAFQRWAIYQDTSFEHFLYSEPTVFTNHWIEEIMRYPHFQEVVKQRWRDFYNSGFNGLDIDRYADEFVASIKPAAIADAAIWPRYDIDIQKADFKRFIHRKIAWLNSQWGAAAGKSQESEKD